MANTTGNTQALIEAEIHSHFFLTNLEDGLLPGTFYRDVSDFGSGTQLNIPTLGDVTIQDVSEDTEMNFQPLESGRITLLINKAKGYAYFITDDLREDGTDIDMLNAQHSQQGLLALQKQHETDFFNTIGAAFVADDPFNVNLFAHKIVSSAVTEVNQTLQLNDIIKMSVAFDKAEVPMTGRILIIDPVSAGTLNTFVSITSDITSFAKEIIEKGFHVDGMRLMWNLYGWDVITSNRLPVIVTGDGTVSGITGGTGNVFMCLADDNVKPVMHAWRRTPSMETERNMKRRRDEFMVTSRYGYGMQRMDSIGVIVTHPTNIEPA